MSDPSLVLPPLPRGRHKLSRDEVKLSQRLRLCVGMAEACAEVGFAQTSVKAVLDRANVSRLTFYELYGSKLDCFLDALDIVSEILIAEFRDANARPGIEPFERAERAIDRYLKTVASNLPYARLYLVEAHAAGPVALRKRAELQSVIVEQIVRNVGARTKEARFACEAYVAAVSDMVTLPVATADVDAIHALRGPLLTLMRRLFTA